LTRSEIERFTTERADLETARNEAEVQLNDAAAAKNALDIEIAQHSSRTESLRIEIENHRLQLAEIQSRLAVMEERRTAAVRELNSLRQQASDLRNAAARAVQQIEEATQQQAATRLQIENLGEAMQTAH
jgi:chromosome segregation ATPase